MLTFDGNSNRHRNTEKGTETQPISSLDVLKDEKENLIDEVLRCCVCLELPVGKQVRICEEGHHFCVTCHNKIEFCGICRGKLLVTRNFVVEQLVGKIGVIFGHTEQELPPAKSPLKLSQGYYPCMHHCSFKTPSYQMLTHLRRKHRDHLVDKVRSNPYSERFSFVLHVNFNENCKYIWSVNVCDLGLITAELKFTNFDFFGCLRVLSDKNPPYKYQLVLRIPNKVSGSKLEFGVTDCPMSSYLDTTEEIIKASGGLSIKGSTLSEFIQKGTPIRVFFSVWESTKKLEMESKISPSLFCAPEGDLHFENDRKTRRNKKRNMRRKRLKQIIRTSEFYDGSDTLSVTDVFGILVL